MMKKFRILLKLSLILIVLVAGFPAAGGVLAYPSSPQASDQQSIDLPLTKWGYEDVSLTGPYSNASYSIGLPSHWQMLPGGKLNLVVNYAFGSTAANNTPSTSSNGQSTYVPVASIQVSLNEKSIYQTYSTTLGEQALSIPLPDSWPKRTESFDRLDISLLVHGPCEYTTYSTLMISKNSSLSLKYHPTPVPLDLSSYPLPFYQRTFLPNAVDIVLPEMANTAQSSAGLAVAAGLGSLTGNKVDLNAVTDTAWEQNSPYPNHVIVVGTPSQNSLIAKLNESNTLPVPVQKRRLKMSISGPGSVSPSSAVTYVTQIENDGTTQLNNLEVRSMLPSYAENVQCQPDCKNEPGQVTWQVGPFAPAATAMYSVTYTIPEKSEAMSATLTSELAQDQKAINVSTLKASVQSGAEPTQVQTKPVSDYFFTLNNRAIPETDGVIELFPSPWQVGKAVLFVTGLTDDAVNNAGIALGSPEHFPGISGQAVLVEDVLPRLTSTRQEASDITLTDLGYKDQVVQGIGRKDIFYYFDLPLSWNLTEDANVRLSFSHSRLLDPRKSSLTLFFNDTPIASTPLDDSNAINGELVGKLSANGARPGLKNSLLVQIEEDVTDRCIIPETSQAWVTVSANSSLNLAHSVSDIKSLFNLDNYPQQFITDPSLNNVIISLPERPNAVEHTLALQTASYLGAASAGVYFHPNLIMGKPDGFDLEKYNVITIGRSTRNPVLQSVNDKLPQPFIPGTDKILQKIDNVIFRLPDNLDLGYVQLIPSPWSSEKVLVAITGTTDQGMLDSEKILNSSENWQLNGNIALIRGEKVFSTDTNELTKTGTAELITTIVPETTVEAVLTGTAVPMPQSTAVPTVQAGANIAKEESSPTYAQQFPLLIPVIAGVSVILIIVVLIIALRRPGKSR
jgi:hypothetical protein